MKKIIFLIAIITLFAAKLNAQIRLDSADNYIKISSLPYYNYGKGLGMTSPDSIFQLNIRFRMQNRVSYIDNEDAENNVIDGQIRRLRLRFDGYVGNPKFNYAIQLSFAPGDVGEVEEGKNTNIIRDAVLFYQPNNHWSIGFGQTKLPGNRQRINSSGALEMTDRSINNARFNIDRDFGFQVHHLQQKPDRFSYNLRGAMTMGEGRNWTDNNDDGLSLTGKVELLPFGPFTKDGTFFEGDLMREQKPKLLLSAAFNQNNQAKRTQGQTGDDLFEQRTMKSLLLDMMFKYRGLSLMAAYMNRIARNPVTYNPENNSEFNYVFTGYGYDFIGSYLLPKDYQLIFRYSNQFVDNDIHQFEPDRNQISIGFTKYIWEHAFKLQSEFSYETENYIDNSSKNNWYVRLQLEIGI